MKEKQELPVIQEVNEEDVARQQMIEEVREKNAKFLDMLIQEQLTRNLSRTEEFIPPNIGSPRGSFEEVKVSGEPNVPEASE